MERYTIERWVQRYNRYRAYISAVQAQAQHVVRTHLGSLRFYIVKGMPKPGNGENASQLPDLSRTMPPCITD